MAKTAFSPNANILSFVLAVLREYTKPDKAITQKELIERVIIELDIPFNDRYLRHYINHIRSEGLEIVGANNNGFYVINDINSLKKYSARLRSQYESFGRIIMGQLKAAKAKQINLSK